MFALVAFIDERLAGGSDDDDSDGDDNEARTKVRPTLPLSTPPYRLANPHTVLQHLSTTRAYFLPRSTAPQKALLLKQLLEVRSFLP